MTEKFDMPGGPESPEFQAYIRWKLYSLSDEGLRRKIERLS